MHDFTSRVAGAKASSTVVSEQLDNPPAPTPAPAKSKAKAKVTEAPAPVVEAPAASNPFAGMPVAEAPAPTPAPAQPAFDRSAILAEVTSFIQAKTQQGIELPKIAAVINSCFFVPAGIAQCKVGELDDTRLAQFNQVFHGTIKQSVENLLTGAGLV